MSQQELKATVDALSDEDRIWLAAYLMHVGRVDSEENKADLSERDRRIDEGKFVTLEQVKRLHAALEAEGL